jgi:hypothetical protein
VSQTTQEQEAATLPPDEPEITATPAWLGRAVLVTVERFDGTEHVEQPWYDGKVTRISEDGEWVEVEAAIERRGWFRRYMDTECEWHSVQDVYLIVEK